MRMIKPWLECYVNYETCSYDRLPRWLMHPYNASDGILDGEMSEEAVKKILYVLCANAKVPIWPDARRTLRALCQAWSERFPLYGGGFVIRSGRTTICTGCCHDINDFVSDLNVIEHLRDDRGGPWLGHDPDTEVVYHRGYLRIFYGSLGERRGKGIAGRKSTGVSFTPIEFHARAWTALWDLYRFTYGPFKSVLTQMNPDVADELIRLWCENLGIQRPPERWY